MKVPDRYSLLCISVSLMILTAALVSGEDPSEEDGGAMLGIAFDVTETKNGYTFSFEDSGGGSRKCFSRTEPEELSVYSIKGEMSDDGGIFFVDSLILVTSE